jgi:hypothetical protein
VSGVGDVVTCPMSLLAVSQWREVLGPELRARSQAFANVEWPIDLDTLPVIDLPLYTDDVDMTARAELILDSLLVFCDAMAPLIANYVARFEFIIAGNVQALVLARRKSDASGVYYHVQMVLLEHMNRLYEFPRLLIYERARDTDLLTLTHTDTNRKRASLQLTPSHVLVQLLLLQFGENDKEGLIARNETQFFRNIGILREAFNGFRSEALARLLKIYMIGPRRIEFLISLVKSAAAVAEGRDGEPALQLQRASMLLADNAPPNFASGDIYALLTAVYGMLRAKDFPRTPEPQTPLALSKRKRDKGLEVTDDAIERYLIDRKASQSPKTPKQPTKVGRVLEL